MDYWSLIQNFITPTLPSLCFLFSLVQVGDIYFLAVELDML